MLQQILLTLALLWIVIVLLTYMVPYAYGLPPNPTRPARIRRALRMANLQPGEVLFDLGSGDGRVLVMAAKEFGAQAIGIDVGPVQTVQAWVKGLMNGVSSKVQVKMGNFLTADLSKADVVFAYLTSDYVPKLEPRLMQQLKPGARVVTISFDFSRWEPVDFDDDELIFLYTMPPSPGDLGTYLAKQG